jgi:arabinofuranosyltransferase
MLAIEVWDDSPALLLAIGAALLAFAVAWRFRQFPWGRFVAVSTVIGIAAGNALLFRTNAEDAFITYRYASNLADGHGPVFNIGERVEGYSNFLWMILLAGTRAITGAGIESIARTFGLLAALATVYLTYRVTLSLTDRSVGLALLATLLLACSGPFAAYAISGLETPLFALLLVAIVACLIGARLSWAGILTALALMTRPDALALVVPIVGWLALVPHRSRRSSLRRVARYILPFALLVAPWTVWRVAYYGHVVPNALAAKFGGAGVTREIRDGVMYAKGFVVAIFPIVIIGAVVVLVPLVTHRMLHVDANAVLLLGLVATLVGFVVVAGGDWMPAWRLLAPITPLLVILLAHGSHLNREAWQSALDSHHAVVLAAAASVVLVATSAFHSNLIPRVRVWSDEVQAMATEGSWFQRQLPGSTIAVYANGALSYHAGSAITMVDMLGLTDEHIARDGERDSSAWVGHRAHDDAYVRSRRPDVIVFTGTGFSATPSCEVEPGYAPEYVGETFRVRTDNPTGTFANVLVRADKVRQVSDQLGKDRAVELDDCDE